MRPGASPNQNGIVGDAPPRVLDAHLPAADPADAPGAVAQEKHVAPHALDGEVLVHRAHEHVVGLGYHVVVGIVGDRAAVGERDQTGPPAAAQLAVHRVPVHVGGPPSLARRDATGEHVHHLVEPLAGQVHVRVGAPDQLEQLVLVLLRRAGLGDDLLGQHVEGPGWDRQRVQVAPPYAADEGHALDKLVPRQGEEPALRRAAQEVARAPDPLEQQADGARRSYLAHQVDRAHVDAKLQRSRGDAHLHLAGLEPLLGVAADLLGEAAVVGRHRLLPQALGHLVGQALDQPARVHEEDGRVVLAHQVGHAVEGVAPLLVGGDGADLVLGHLDGQVHLPRVARVDDQAVRLPAGGDVRCADEESPDLLDGPLGRREADAGDRPVGQPAQALDGEAQVGAALVVGDGVQLVEDQGADARQPAPPALGREQDVERLRRGDEHVRGPLRHRLPLGRGGVAGTQADADLRQGRPALLGEAAYLGQGPGQVALDVVRQGLEGRDVDDLGRLGQAAVQPGPDEAVQAGHEGGQGLAGAGGRGHQGVGPARNGGPPLGLRAGRGLEAATEPLPDQRMKLREYAGHW